MSTGPDSAQPAAPISDEDRAKDVFYDQVAALANAMITAHGKDFAMGTLVLAARFIAEGKSLGASEDGSDKQFGAAPIRPQ